MAKLFVLLQYLLPQHGLSRLAGRLAQSRRWRRVFISLFIRRFRVDLSEALIQDPAEFANFNDFFTRALKAQSRPLAADPDGILCPADGAISQVGLIEEDQLLQAKGQYFALSDLLGGDSDTAGLFHNGAFVTVYLSPKDYHRVHMPIGGRLVKTLYVPGSLFSVNQATTQRVPGLFARNERLVCLFETKHGPMAIIMVGAMIVAGIDTVWAGAVAPGPNPRQLTEQNFSHSQPIIELEKGAEMGRFRLGSTAIIVFPAQTITFLDSLQANSGVRMGQLLGHIRPAT